MCEQCEETFEREEVAKMASVAGTAFDSNATALALLNDTLHEASLDGMDNRANETFNTVPENEAAAVVVDAVVVDAVVVDAVVVDAVVVDAVVVDAVVGEEVKMRKVEFREDCQIIGADEIGPKQEEELDFKVVCENKLVKRK